MRRSFKHFVFSTFDKAIALVLALALVVYIIVVFSRGQQGGNLVELQKLLENIENIQRNSVHQPSVLDKDYLTQTIGGFRPDIEGAVPRQYIFGGSPTTKDPEAWKLPASFQIQEEEPAPGPVERDVPPMLAGCEIRVERPNAVKAEWAKDRPHILIISAVGAGSSTVELIHAGKTYGPINVNVAFLGKPVPTVSTPVQFTVTAEQGQTVLSWRASAASFSTVTVYRIYRGEKSTALTPYLAVQVAKKRPAKQIALPPPPPPPPPSGGVVKGGPQEPKGGPASGASQGTGSPAAPPPPASEQYEEVPTVAPDGTPGPMVKFDGATFTLNDRQVLGGATYYYTIQAVAVDKYKKALTSAKTEVKEVLVEESFKIKFFTLSRTSVKLVISVFHVPEQGPGSWVEQSFVMIERGEPVGWKMADVVVPGQNIHLKNVDFSTGYQVLDILNDEPRAKEEDSGDDKQVQETRQKLLLINDKGRIKVLWPEL